MFLKNKELGFSADFPALLVFDNFSGQCTPKLLKTIDDHHNIFCPHSPELHCHVYGMCGRVSRIIKSLDCVNKLRELKRHRDKLGACPGGKRGVGEVEWKKTLNI